MLKVLVVEDMDIIREDIKRLIDWQAHGYELAGEARNGEAGLLRFETVRPDIVITDIRMPVMSGLEMIQRLRDSGADARFILLTDYAEFAYAKRALELNVHAYILKDEMESEILLAALDKVQTEISLQRRFSSVERSDRLRTAISGSIREAVSEPLIKSGEFGVLLAASSSAGSCLASALSEFNFTYTGNSHGTVILLTAPKFVSKKAEADHARRFAELCLSLFHTTDDSSCLAVSPLIASDSDILTVYPALMQLIQQHVFYEKGRILDAMPSEPAETDEQNTADLVEDIIVGFQNADDAILNEKIANLFLDKMTKLKSVTLLERCVRDLSYAAARSAGIDKSGEVAAVLEKIAESTRDASIFLLNDLFQKVARAITERRGVRYSKHVNKIIAYVNAHFRENISLAELSKEIGLSEVYISSMFKKELHITFTAYLTKVRIKKAAELLKTGRYKVYEVSEMVGYQTVQYFSTTFRREMGKKPGDYC
jgi:YesN/AraC family two-component response regulator